MERLETLRGGERGRATRGGTIPVVTTPAGRRTSRGSIPSAAAAARAPSGISGQLGPVVGHGAPEESPPGTESALLRLAERRAGPRRGRGPRAVEVLSDSFRGSAGKCSFVGCSWRPAGAKRGCYLPNQKRFLGKVLEAGGRAPATRWTICSPSAWGDASKSAEKTSRM